MYDMSMCPHRHEVLDFLLQCADLLGILYVLISEDVEVLCAGIQTRYVSSMIHRQY